MNGPVMKTTTKQQTKARPQYHPEYGRLRADIDLGLAMLIAEAEDGAYQPVTMISTINEAIEVASNDMASRMKDLEHEPMCPAIYRIWSRNYDGEYSISCEIDAATLQPVRNVPISQ
jgi:hypothetical protein